MTLNYFDTNGFEEDKGKPGEGERGWIRSTKIFKEIKIERKAG